MQSSAAGLEALLVLLDAISSVYARLRTVTSAFPGLLGLKPHLITCLFGLKSCNYEELTLLLCPHSAHNALKS